MKRLACLILLCAPRLFAQAPDGKVIDAIIEEAMKSWQIPGAAVAIVKGDDVLYAKGYGVRDMGKEQPVTTDTLFAIASCTKAFTATSVALLVEEGKMAWDDPVRKHIEFFRLADPLAERDVTIRDLLCHRTGLSRHDMLWIGTNWGEEELLRHIGHARLSQPFRSAFQYNNIMYIAAGHAVGKATKGKWEHVVEDRIFKPLGMTTATTDLSRAAISPNHARPHRRNEEGKPEPLEWRHRTISAAGSIHASVSEMTRWVRFQLGDGALAGTRLLQSNTLKEMHTPQIVLRLDTVQRIAYPDTKFLSYGLGWFIHDHKGRLMYSHTGGLEGFRARVVLVPEEKLGIIFLMNSGVGSSYASAHFVVTNQILDMLWRQAGRDWNAYFLAEWAKMDQSDKAELKRRIQSPFQGTKPSHPLQAYAGMYEDPTYGQVQVAVKHDTLVLEWGRFRTELKHVHFDTFIAKERTPQEVNPLESQQVVFQLDASGVISGMSFLGQSFGRAVAPRAKHLPSSGS